MMDKEEMSYGDYLSYRLSPTEDACTEGWNGNTWVPIAYHRSKEDAIISLVFDKSEGANVELSEEMIVNALHSLKRTAKRVARHIAILEAAQS